jgi:hypothetical protein
MAAKFYQIVCDFDTWGFTPDGGIYQTFTNRTGDDSVKGTIVMQSTTEDHAVVIAAAGSPLAFGVVYEDNISIGSQVKVVVMGKAQVLLRTGESIRRGHWCVLSSVTDGRMEEGTITGTLLLSEYAEGIGVSLEDKSSGLAWIELQFT